MREYEGAVALLAGGIAVVHGQEGVLCRQVAYQPKANTKASAAATPIRNFGRLHRPEAADSGRGPPKDSAGTGAGVTTLGQLGG